MMRSATIQTARRVAKKAISGKITLESRFSRAQENGPGEGAESTAKMSRPKSGVMVKTLGEPAWSRP